MQCMYVLAILSRHINCFNCWSISLILLVFYFLFILLMLFYYGMILFLFYLVYPYCSFSLSGSFLLFLFCVSCIIYYI